MGKEKVGEPERRPILPALEERKPMESMTSGRPLFRKPPPEGVVEVLGIGREWSIAGLDDGSLLAARHRQCRFSRDGGESWSEERDLLNSGALARSPTTGCGSPATRAAPGASGGRSHCLAAPTAALVLRSTTSVLGCFRG